MTDSRSTFRYRTHRPASIILPGGGSISCVVHDISTKGARLEVAALAKVPDDFFLLIRGERFRCHRIWQKDNMIGVQYL
jgi:PilZ domain